MVSCGGSGFSDAPTLFDPDSLATDIHAGDSETPAMLNLRPGVTWTNGDPFTASDVAFNIERFADGLVAANAMALKQSVLHRDHADVGSPAQDMAQAAALMAEAGM